MSEKIMAGDVYCYTLADLEQARKQGAEEERAAAIRAVAGAIRGEAGKKAIFAIRALGDKEEGKPKARREFPINPSLDEALNSSDGTYKP